MDFWCDWTAIRCISLLGVGADQRTALAVAVIAIAPAYSGTPIDNVLRWPSPSLKTISVKARR